MEERRSSSVVTMFVVKKGDAIYEIGRVREVRHNV
jgi:hypothetical protein